VFAAHFELPLPSCSLSCYGNFTPSPFQGQQQEEEEEAEEEEEVQQQPC